MSDWKTIAMEWRRLYVKVRDEAGIGDTSETVRVESATRRLAEEDAGVSS